MYIYIYNYIWKRASRYILNETSEALPDVLRNSLVSATVDWQRWKQHGCNTWTRSLKNSRKNLKYPFDKTSQTALFRATTKTKMLVFVCFGLCPFFVDEKLGKETNMLIVDLIPRSTFNRLAANRETPHHSYHFSLSPSWQGKWQRK